MGPSVGAGNGGCVGDGKGTAVGTGTGSSVGDAIGSIVGSVTGTSVGTGFAFPIVVGKNDGSSVVTTSGSRDGSTPKLISVELDSRSSTLYTTS